MQLNQPGCMRRGPAVWQDQALAQLPPWMPTPLLEKEHALSQVGTGRCLVLLTKHFSLGTSEYFMGLSREILTPLAVLVTASGLSMPRA